MQVIPGVIVAETLSAVEAGTLVVVVPLGPVLHATTPLIVDPLAAIPLIAAVAHAAAVALEAVAVLTAAVALVAAEVAAVAAVAVADADNRSEK